MPPSPTNNWPNFWKPQSRKSRTVRNESSYDWPSSLLLAIWKRRNMSKRKTDQFFEEVRRFAKNLGEEEESLSPEQVRARLRETGIDPDQLKAHFHEAALKFAKRETLANRYVPLLLKQAIDTTRPDHQFP